MTIAADFRIPGLPVNPLFGNHCRECSQICANFLRHSGVNATFFSRGAESPSESAYLAPSNPRLAELRRLCAASRPPELAPSQWSAEFVARDVPLQAFRGDCAYVWQRRDFNTPASYILTTYYVLAGPAAPLLKRLTEDGAFGAYTIPFDESLVVSRDLLDSVSELAFLQRHGVIDDRSGITVLDIGSGYGRFAHRLHEAFCGLHAVFCVDSIPESTFLCEYYLRYHGIPSKCATAVMVTDFDNIVGKVRVDLAVNIHSFSECSVKAIEWWLDLLRSRDIPRLFIVPNPPVSDRARLTSTEPDGRHIPFEDLVLSRGYSLIASEPKYSNMQVQKYGITPTYYYLFELSR